MSKNQIISGEISDDDVKEAVSAILDHIEKRLKADGTVSPIEILESAQSFMFAIVDMIYRINTDIVKSRQPLAGTMDIFSQMVANTLKDSREFFPPDETIQSEGDHIKENTNPMPDRDVLVAGFDAYQARSIGTISYPPEMAIWYPALGLGEAGEVQNKVKKVFRDDGGVLTPERRAAIKKEMGGVVWYLAALAHGMGESLGEIAMDNLEELASRQERGTLHGDGDDR